jgi:hypothetical protein
VHDQHIADGLTGSPAVEGKTNYFLQARELSLQGIGHMGRNSQFESAVHKNRG